MGIHTRAKMEGEVLYQDENLLEASPRALNRIRGQNLSMIFQDPLTALNPLMTIGHQIEEVLLLHRDDLSGRQRKERAIELLGQVGISHPELTYSQYPHELSGGMRQRVVIAIAIANNPEVLIADEPTTALDATIQSQILNLMNDLKEKMNAGIILITHDLGVVAEMADRVAVMYASQIVELTDVHTLFNSPKHPYTRSLLESIPSNADPKEKLHVIQGIVPSLQYLPREGCRFSHRIPWIDQSAHDENPVLEEIEPGHFVRCSCYKHFDFAREKEDERIES